MTSWTTHGHPVRQRSQRIGKALAVMGLLLLFAVSLVAQATELPPTVLSYLREKDPGVKVRFDGMVSFPNGEVYLPIFPQDPSMSRNPTQVLSEEPEGNPYPDMIHFDNNLFLIRLINTASGKLALAKLDTYPIELKEGLLPQDLLLPPNLYIPTELKVILGDLPYAPQEAVSETLPNTPEQIAEDVFKATHRSPIQKTLYMTDIDEQSLVVVDPDAARTKEKIELNCVAANVVPSDEGHAVYVTCLTTDELVVVDTFSNLVKARVAVGSKPADVLYLEGENRLFVSHRYSNFLSVVDTVELVSTSKILLPGNGGEMVRSKKSWHVYVADYSAGKIYEVDTDTQQVLRTLPGLKNMSAIWLDERRPDQPRMWIASRSRNQVMVMDVITGEPLAAIDVGEKPVAFAPMPDKEYLYVVSASLGRVDVIDVKTMSLEEPAISLGATSFPTAITLSESDDKAYVAAAGTDDLFVVDLKNRVVEKTLPLQVRGKGLVLLGVKRTETAGSEENQEDSANEETGETIETQLEETAEPAHVPDETPQETQATEMPLDLTPELPKVEEAVKEAEEVEEEPVKPPAEKATETPKAPLVTEPLVKEPLIIEEPAETPKPEEAAVQDASAEASVPEKQAVDPISEEPAAETADETPEKAMEDSKRKQPPAEERALPDTPPVQSPVQTMDKAALEKELKRILNQSEPEQSAVTPQPQTPAQPLPKPKSTIRTTQPGKQMNRGVMEALKKAKQIPR